jgi:hypothetical protein
LAIEKFLRNKGFKELQASMKGWEMPPEIFEN